MDWQVKSLSKECVHSGQKFEPGHEIVSYLYLNKEGELERADILAGDDSKNFVPEGPVMGWWTADVKDGLDESALKKQAIQTKEELFFSLFEDSEVLMPEFAEGGQAEEKLEAENSDEEYKEEPQERNIMRYLLSIMLERKRIIKPVGRASAEGIQGYVHVKTKKTFLVPIVDITGEDVFKVQAQLQTLIG